MKKVHIFNSFVGKTSFSGNPAGIVFNENLSEAEMQNIASRIGLSETVFIEKHHDIFRFRFFTPLAEVDLCGHATIAAAAFLLENLHCSFPLPIQTNAGIIKLFQEKDCFFMEQPLPYFGKQVDFSFVAESLHADKNFFPSNLKPQIVSTGLPDLIIPIRTAEILHCIKPDFDRISAISKELDVVGYHLFALSKVQNTTAFCRNFAPLLGIKEEAATGTASGALACYLFHKGIQKSEYTFEQGNAMGKPSAIEVMIKEKEGTINEIKVGGKVRFIK